jgi:hypothetical protein
VYNDVDHVFSNYVKLSHLGSVERKKILVTANLKDRGIDRHDIYTVLKEAYQKKYDFTKYYVDWIAYEYNGYVDFKLNYIYHLDDINSRKSCVFCKLGDRNPFYNGRMNDFRVCEKQPGDLCVWSNNHTIPWDYDPGFEFSYRHEPPLCCPHWHIVDDDQLYFAKVSRPIERLLRLLHKKSKIIKIKKVIDVPLPLDSNYNRFHEKLKSTFREYWLCMCLGTYIKDYAALEEKFPYIKGVIEFYISQNMMIIRKETRERMLNVPDISVVYYR